MTKTNQHHAEVKDEPKDRFSSDLQTLKNGFAELRDDVTKLLDNTLDTGKHGAGVLRERGAQSVEEFGEKIKERPLLSAAIALGIGFVLGKLFTSKR